MKKKGLVDMLPLLATYTPYSCQSSFYCCFNSSSHSKHI